MKKTSKNSGAEKGDWFDENYRDKDGKVMWDKVKRDAVPITREEFLRPFREARERKRKGPEGDQKAE